MVLLSRRPPPPPPPLLQALVDDSVTLAALVAVLESYSVVLLQERLLPEGIALLDWTFGAAWTRSGSRSLRYDQLLAAAAASAGVLVTST